MDCISPVRLLKETDTRSFEIENNSSDNEIALSSAFCNFTISGSDGLLLEMAESAIRALLTDNTNKEVLIAGTSGAINTVVRSAEFALMESGTLR
jgi:hypothetical protein